jgi:hypothetical protein
MLSVPIAAKAGIKTIWTNRAATVLPVPDAKLISALTAATKL